VEFTMKKTTTILATFILVAASLGVAWATSAASHYATASEGNHVTIDGTSNLHDWDVEGETIHGKAAFPEAVTSLAGAAWLKSRDVNPKITVTIPVRSLRSGHRGMDGNMYDALHADAHSDIVFRLGRIWATKKKDADHVRARATGKLTVAGKTRGVALDVDIARDGDHLVFTGHTRLDMTAFGVKPPTAMLGVLKTGKMVDVRFVWGIVRR